MFIDPFFFLPFFSICISHNLKFQYEKIKQVKLSIWIIRNIMSYDILNTQLTDQHTWICFGDGSCFFKVTIVGIPSHYLIGCIHGMDSMNSNSVGKIACAAFLDWFAIQNQPTYVIKILLQCIFFSPSLVETIVFPQMSARDWDWPVQLLELGRKENSL